MNHYEQNTTQEYVATLRDRIGLFFFPAAYLEPWEEDENWSPGDLSTTVNLHLDWLDRLRVLVSGKISIRTRTRTDRSINRSQAKSISVVLPPWARVDQP